MLDRPVYAVIVTYNRLPLLKNTIASVKAQTFLPDKVIIINNDSTDGTTEWLQTQPDLLSLHQPNLGSSGGQAKGLQTAYNMGADWVWMMDDDVMAQPDCLASLARYTHLSSCLHPIHIDDDGKIIEEERMFDPVSCTIWSLFNTSYKNGKKIWYRNIGSFEGMLVNRRIIEKAGWPDSRFFLMHDDLAYGYQCSKHTNVAVVAEAIMHKQKKEETTNAYAKAQYYLFRNLWLLEEMADTDFPQYKQYRKRRIKLQFLYEIYRILLVHKKQKPQLLSMLRLAYRHYKKKVSGKLPQ